MPVKNLLALIAFLVWLGALVLGIYSCPRYLSGHEHIIYADFEQVRSFTSDLPPSAASLIKNTSQNSVRDLSGGYNNSPGLRLTADGRRRPFAGWSLPVPQGVSFLKLQGRLRTEQIKAGNKSWHAARLLLYFTDTEGKDHWDYAHTAARLTGTTPWEKYEKVFPVPDWAVTVHVTVQNSAASGTLWCDNILLQEVHTNAAYILFTRFLMASGIVLAVGVISVFRLWKKGGWLPLSVVAVIITGVMCSNTILLNLVGGLSPGSLLIVKKSGHFFLFLILGLLTVKMLRSHARDRSAAEGGGWAVPAAVLGGLTVFAVITELLQFTTVDRTPSLADLAIDMTGSIVGICLGWYITKGAAKNKKHLEVRNISGTARSKP